MGCYTDNDVTKRTLVGAATTGASMTVELCASFCKGFTYFGLEYADECYCSNTVASTGLPATDERCSMACAGNSAELCGGSYGLNLYSLLPSSTTSTARSTSTSSAQVTTSSSLLSTSSTSSTSISSTPTPSIPATVSAYTYLHCHSDNTTIRTLQGKYIGKPDMTIEHCAGNCSGYAYFGLEYMQECYCSNTLSFGSYIATDGRCDMLCGGNSREICGGASGLTLYQNLTGVVSVSSSSSVGSSTTSSVLSLSMSVSSSVSTTSSSQASTPSTSTSSPLPTSSSSFSSSLSTSVWSLLTTTSSSLTSSPISSVGPSSSSSTSPPSVSSSTSSSSAPVPTSQTTSSSVLLSSSNQLSTSQTTSDSSSSSVQTTSTSQSPSPSSSTQSSTWSELSSSQMTSSTSSPMQSISTSESSTSSSSSVLSTSTSSLSVSSTTSSSATASPTSSPWTYVGCASDNVLSRTLTGSSTTSSTAMTIEYCQSYCSSKNFGLAGIEYSSECYCGYALTNNSTLGQTGCDMACSGSKSEVCGGSKLLSVYNDTSFIPPSIPQAVGSYNYTGCYTELTNARALSSYSLTSTSSMTVEMCVGACEAKGYALAGVEYGSQCFCGNSISAQSSRVADSQCEVMLCPGNNKEWCSAGSRLQVYST